MGEDKNLSREILKISARIEKIEARLGGLDVGPEHDEHAPHAHYCSMPLGG